MQNILRFFVFAFAKKQSKLKKAKEQRWLGMSFSLEGGQLCCLSETLLIFEYFTLQEVVIYIFYPEQIQSRYFRTKVEKVYS